MTCVGSDGKRLAAGGRSNLLHLWCLDSKQLVRVIQMPTQVRTVRQLEFLPDSFDGGANQVRSPTDFSVSCLLVSVVCVCLPHDHFTPPKPLWAVCFSLCRFSAY